MILNSNTAAMAEADMAKPIPTSKQGIDTSSKEVATIKKPVTHMLSKRATHTLHNPLRHNKPTEGDSNRVTTRADTVKPRR